MLNTKKNTLGTLFTGFVLACCSFAIFAVFSGKWEKPTVSQDSDSFTSGSIFYSHEFTRNGLEWWKLRGAFKNHYGARLLQKDGYRLPTVADAMELQSEWDDKEAFWIWATKDSAMYHVYFNDGDSDGPFSDFIIYAHVYLVKQIYDEHNSKAVVKKNRWGCF